MDVKVRSGCQLAGGHAPLSPLGACYASGPDAVRTAPSPRTAMLYSAVLMRRLYLITRDLHLYLGMFISPFVLVFSLSVILLVHGLVPAATPEPAVRTVTGLSLPVGLERLARPPGRRRARRPPPPPRGGAGPPPRAPIS